MNGQNEGEAEAVYENASEIQNEPNENINNVESIEEEQKTIGPTRTDERPLLERPPKSCLIPMNERRKK